MKIYNYCIATAMIRKQHVYVAYYAAINSGAVCLERDMHGSEAEFITAM